MDEMLRQLVQDRAGGICEYCHFPEEHSFNPFQMDHIIADKHGGLTSEPNLAWSCFNTYKGSNVAGWDAAEDVVVRLFQPRHSPVQDMKHFSGGTHTFRPWHA